jgi:hypothetical protein
VVVGTKQVRRVNRALDRLHDGDRSGRVDVIHEVLADFADAVVV